MTTVTASAPGRVNLIGEHTDYNNGFVLPMPIPLSTSAQLRLRSDYLVKISTDRASSSTDQYEYDLKHMTATGKWPDYVVGVTWVLEKAGFALKGFDLLLRSDVPEGSGLSSSAALEVSVVRALRVALDLKMDDVSLAILCRRAEVEFVGAHVGIMDQMASSVGKLGHALFLDTSDLSWKHLALPQRLDLLVIHSGISHQHATGDYNQRWSECQEACGILGIDSLRQLAPGDLPNAFAKLRTTLTKRVRHVVTENARVLAAVRALEEGNLQSLGDLFRQSHDSMRDDFEVSIPEIDLLVDLANRLPQVYGARLTGGGFGGSIVVAARSGCGAELANSLLASYRERTGRDGTAFVAWNPVIQKNLASTKTDASGVE